MPDQQSTAVDPAISADNSVDELVINGVRYGNTKRLAAIFHVSERTVGRWVSLRIGPPRIKIGKLVLFNLERLSEWLAEHEVGPLRSGARGRGGHGAP